MGLFCHLNVEEKMVEEGADEDGQLSCEENWVEDGADEHGQ